MRAAHNALVTAATCLAVTGAMAWAPWPSSALLGTALVAMGAMTWRKKPHPRRVHRLLVDWEQAEIGEQAETLRRIYDRPGGAA